jgi:hypothetical protein
MAGLHISAKNNNKITCFTPLEANRTRNRMVIRTRNRTCRRPLSRYSNQARIAHLLLYPCRDVDGAHDHRVIIEMLLIKDGDKFGHGIGIYTKKGPV